MVKEHADTTTNHHKEGLAPKTNSASRMYNVLLFLLVFCLLSFVMTVIAHPPEASVSEEHLRKEVILSEFIGKAKGTGNEHGSEKDVYKGDDAPIPIRNVVDDKSKSRITTKNSNIPADGIDENGLRTRPPYHVVFSTSCEDQQNWESYVLFYHAMKVRQPGTVTRIASGCTEQQGQEIQKFHDEHIGSLSSKFHLHLTPDFSRGDFIAGKSRYKYMNKPYGLRHWMETELMMGQDEVLPGIEDGIVILLDPDIILLRPIVHDYTNEDVIFVDSEVEEANKVVRHGNPIAQQDGYLTNQWRGLNATYITNGGNIKHTKPADGPKHYNTGPPYLATVRDMYNIAVLWTDYAPRVYEVHPKLFAEMFGYIFATTQLNLPHTLIRSLVVSTTTTGNREGWRYIDDLPKDKVCNVGDSPLPVGLHYCKRYLLEKWFFSKYRLKKKFISCESPILEPPPKDLATKGYTYSLQPPPHGHDESKEKWTPEKKAMSPRTAKREAFMLCAMIAAVNEAATYFKQNSCSVEAANYTKITFWSEPDH